MALGETPAEHGIFTGPGYVSAQIYTHRQVNVEKLLI